ncbi:MAG: hypothetical protein JSV31_00390 [Desulfobacterales bacterium]|nr:MAG: hypothetical protein JSV31_00390 [Desulfobacterales bacterium]
MKHAVEIITKRQLSDDGIAFIRDVLSSLRYKAKWSDRKLARILKNIYGKNGFYVKNRPPIRSGNVVPEKAA